MQCVDSPDEAVHLRDAAYQIALQADPQADYVIVPLGTAGQLIWLDGLISYASFLVSVRPEAILFFREASPSKDPFLQAVAHPDWKGAVTEALALPLGVTGLPLLVPADRPLPDAQQVQLQSLNVNGTTGIALRAGLSQILDDLTRSHELAQEIEGVGKRHLGDYWHAIMHRREPDYFNAKYWFRRLGHHPVMQELTAFVPEIFASINDPDVASWKSRLLRDRWDPLAFVDLCEAGARDEESPLGLTARKIQWMEMLLLLRLCVRESQSAG